MDTYIWKLPRATIELGSQTRLMGILNLTPDSFSDGGLWTDPERALDHALELEAEGADILDVGGESTRPGGEPVSGDEELRRVLPTLEKIAPRLKIPISIDTYRSGVARAALDAGAQIINDVSGFRLDEAMFPLARESGAGVVLMHSRGKRGELHVRPGDDHPALVREELVRSIQKALDHGIGGSRIVADPGLGFSKTPAMTLKVLKRLDLFSTLGCPLLVGPSRKSFIRVDIDIPEVTSWATAASVALAIAGGAHIIRVHEVSRMRVVARIADSIRNA